MHNLEILDVLGEFKIEVDLDTWTGKHFHNIITGGNLYEPESYLLVKALKEGDRFIDVGAHVGWYSILAAKRKVSVEAFEPNVTSYLRLLRNIELNGLTNIVPHCMAMAGERGIFPLYINADNDGGHALWDVGELQGNVETAERGKQIQQTYATTIDRWVGRMTGRLWVKLDTEGTEQKILEKFPFDLGLSKAPVFIVEINRDALAKTGSSEMQLRDWFASRGCHTFAFSDHKLVLLAPTDAVQSNFVFNLVFSADDLRQAFPDAC